MLAPRTTLASSPKVKRVHSTEGGIHEQKLPTDTVILWNYRYIYFEVVLDELGQSEVISN